MTSFAFDRRAFLGRMLAAGGFFLLPRIASAQAATLGDPQPFSFEMLQETARVLAQQPFVPADIPDAAVLDRIDYDDHNRITFRRDRTLWLGQGRRPPVQPFFPGRFFRQPVRLHAVENGMAREMAFDLDLFDIPEGNPARELTHTRGFAGFRVKDAGTELDWMAFLGASYWRTSGYSGQFGLSVRGLETLGRGDGVTMEVAASHGTVGEVHVYPVVGTDRWRAMFDLDLSALPDGDDTPVDIRAFVRHGDAAKSETLILQLFPSQVRALLASRA